MVLVPSEYCHGTIISDRPERPDPSPEERAAARKLDWIGFADMIRTVFNGDEAAWERAGAFDFPKALGRRLLPGGSMGESFYSKTLIADWCAKVRALAASLPKGTKGKA